jgi:hypothetical protein
VNERILTSAQLEEITGYHRQSDIERCLMRQGVRVLHGKSGIFTTVDALNAALGVKSESQPNDPIEIL